MEFEPNISQLDNVVTKLLEEYDVVKKKCEQLTLDLAESLAQIDELREEKNILLNEKETVHSRVTTMLEKLSDWQDGLDGEADVESADSPKDVGGQLFSMDSSSS